MIGIVLKREATHSNNVSPNELRLRPYRNRWRNLVEFS